MLPAEALSIACCSRLLTTTRRSTNQFWMWGLLLLFCLSNPFCWVWEKEAKVPLLAPLAVGSCGVPV